MKTLTTLPRTYTRQQYTTDQTLEDMIALSQRMQVVAAQLAEEASLGREVRAWTTASDFDTANFNKQHAL